MHHLTYRHPKFNPAFSWTREWIFGEETPDDLRALCRDCHHDAHTFDGQFFADIDDLNDEERLTW